MNCLKIPRRFWPTASSMKWKCGERILDCIHWCKTKFWIGWGHKFIYNRNGYVQEQFDKYLQIQDEIDVSMEVMFLDISREMKINLVLNVDDTWNILNFRETEWKWKPSFHFDCISCLSPWATRSCEYIPKLLRMFSQVSSRAKKGRERFLKQFPWRFMDHWKKVQ